VAGGEAEKAWIRELHVLELDGTFRYISMYSDEIWSYLLYDFSNRTYILGVILTQRNLENCGMMFWNDSLAARLLVGVSGSTEIFNSQLNIYMISDNSLDYQSSFSSLNLSSYCFH